MLFENKCFCFIGLAGVFRRVPRPSLPGREVADGTEPHHQPQPHLFAPRRGPLGFYLHRAFDPSQVMSITGPLPVFGFCHQTSRYRVRCRYFSFSVSFSADHTLKS